MGDFFRSVLGELNQTAREFSSYIQEHTWVAVGVVLFAFVLWRFTRSTSR